MKRFLLLAIAALAAMAPSACSDSSDGPSLISMKIDPVPLTLETGVSATLSVRFDPETFEGSVVWKSCDLAIATVEEGTVTAVAAGKTIVTAACAGQVAECEVTVVPAPVLMLDRTELSLRPGAVESLKVSFDPADAEGPVEWKSSDASVVTVDGGKVTAVAAGEAAVTASCGRMKAECKVRVTTTEFNLLVRDITSSTFVLAADPRDPAACYLYGAAHKSVWEASSADVLASLVDEIEYYLKYFTVEELIEEDVISRGASSYTFDLIEASADLVGYAVKFDLAAMAIVGDAETVEFHTLDVIPSDNRFSVSFDASAGIVSVRTTNDDYWYWALLTAEDITRFASPEEAYRTSLDEMWATGHFSSFVSSGDEEIDLSVEMVQGRGLHLLLAGWNGGIATEIVDFVFDYTPSASVPASAGSRRMAAVDKARAAGAPVKRVLR